MTRRHFLHAREAMPLLAADSAREAPFCVLNTERRSNQLGVL